MSTFYVPESAMAIVAKNINTRVALPTKRFVVWVFVSAPRVMDVQ